MITNALPDIPRSYTAICEWAACVVYIAVLFRRVPPRRSVVVSAIGLAALIAVQYFDGSMPIWFLDRRHAARLRLHVPDDSVRRRHRQTRRTVHHGARVRTGRTGGVAALADRHVHRHAQRPIRGLRLACRLTARCHLRIVFRPGLAGGTRQFQPDRAHVADGFAATATVAITIVTFAMSNLSFISTNTPFSGSMGQEIFYIRTLVDFCGFAILYAQQEQARRIEASAEIASINSAAGKPTSGVPAVEGEHRIAWSARARSEASDRGIACREVDPEHAAAGFEQLEKSVQRYSAQQHTGNPVLDVIPHHKRAHLRRSRHQFHRRGGWVALTNMSSMDIASLFGNAIDNAIEATSKAGDPEQRLIKLAFVRAEFLHRGPHRELLRFAAEERCRGQSAHHEAR